MSAIGTETQATWRQIFACRRIARNSLECSSRRDRGAGTFDGIFLTGILAVLLASLYARPRAAHAG